MRIVRTSHLVFVLGLGVVLGGGAAVIGAQMSPGGAWFGLVPLLLVVALGLRRPLRRRRVAGRPFPQAWRDWLEARVPFYGRLEARGRRRFERDVRFFLDEQTFEAVGGAEVTDAVRLSVAAGAALLLHGRPDWELPATRTLLFYPDRFDDDYYGGAYADYDGMVHAQGPIIFSVPAVLEAWEDAADGDNVVLHELAHLFDFRQGEAAGAPSLMDASSAEAWAQLVRQEMRKARRGASLLRRYAATNPAELFAVAVENFFERPARLQRRHPELYAALVAFFDLDPSATRHPPASARAPESKTQ